MTTGRSSSPSSPAAPLVTTAPSLRRADGATVPEDHVIVLFGAGGDLAKRKLLPGLFHLATAGLMPYRFRIIGTSRRDRPDHEFRELARQAIGEGAEPDVWERFAARLSAAAFGPGSTESLTDAVKRAEDELGGQPRRLLYLSVPPSASGEMVKTIGASDLDARARVVLEKPFGTDLQSARRLNTLIGRVLPEDRVYRIDHFLGREAVQNLIALRFANGMFEPVWNRNHIDHVQIDVPETLAVDGGAGFYEQTGAYRDIVVTHLFHVLGFVAMEPPTSLHADALGEESDKVFRSIEPILPEHTIRGQYTGSRDQDGVSPDSETLRPRHSSRRGSRSRTGAGPACRSTCAPASASPTNGGCSQSSSGARHAECSTSPTRWSRTSDPTTSPSTSPTPVGSLRASSPRSPGPECD